MKRARRDFFFLTLVLLVILAAAAALRFYDLGNQSLWSDEGNSAAMAGRSLAQIAAHAALDIQPPLYYWLLHFWTQLFGLSETALRALSAVTGVLLVAASAELGRRLYGENTGLAIAFIAALAPFQVYYSQEARMYILLALLTTTSFLFFWEFVAAEAGAGSAPGVAGARWSWFPLPGLWLVLSWIAGLYTHYLFPLVIGINTALYLCWVWGTRRQGLVRQRLQRWAILLALALAVFGPWLPTMMHQAFSWPNTGSTMGLFGALQATFGLFALGPAGDAPAGQWQTYVLLALAVCGAVPWLYLLSRYVRPARPDFQPAGQGELERPSAWYWLRWLSVVAWAAGPVLVMLVLGLYRDSYLKFLLIASPAFSFLLARGIAGPVRAVNRWARAHQAFLDRPAIIPISALASIIWVIVALALITAVYSTALARTFSDPALARDDYRGIVQFINATAQQEDAIVLDAPGQSEVFDYYYHGSLPVNPLPRQRPLDQAATSQELDTLVSYDKVYVLYWATQEADPSGLIEGWLNNNSYKTMDEWYGNVRLAVYVMPQRRPPDETADGLNLRLGPQITLLGYRGWNLALHAGEVTQVQLLWRASTTPTRRYKVFLQLLDPLDQVIAQRDAEPAGESRPTITWAPGEVITDNHGLLIPPGTPPGTYRRILGMYDAETMERLHLPNGEDHIELPPITVARSPTPPPLAALGMQHSQSFDFGGIKLLGYDCYKRDFGYAPATPLYPGDLLHLTFYWQANVQPRADWWFDLALTDNAGNMVAQLQAPLVGPTYSTTFWEPREVVRGEHDLTLPADLAPATYRLSLTLLPDTNTPAGVAYLSTVQIQKH